jgi:hypothetical protein
VRELVIVVLIVALIALLRLQPDQYSWNPRGQAAPGQFGMGLLAGNPVSLTGRVR